jgi:hypothetical protein
MPYIIAVSTLKILPCTLYELWRQQMKANFNGEDTTEFSAYEITNKML